QNCSSVTAPGTRQAMPMMAMALDGTELDCCEATTGLSSTFDTIRSSIDADLNRPMLMRYKISQPEGLPQRHTRWARISGGDPSISVALSIFPEKKYPRFPAPATGWQWRRTL